MFDNHIRTCSAPLIEQNEQLVLFHVRKRVVTLTLDILTTIVFKTSKIRSTRNESLLRPRCRP